MAAGQDVYDGDNGSANLGRLKILCFLYHSLNTNRVHVKIMYYNEPGSKLLCCYQAAARSVKVLNAWVEDNCDTIWGAYSDNSVRVWDGGEGNTYRKGVCSGVTLNYDQCNPVRSSAEIAERP